MISISPLFFCGCVHHFLESFLFICRYPLPGWLIIFVWAGWGCHSDGGIGGWGWGNGLVGGCGDTVWMRGCLDDEMQVVSQGRTERMVVIVIRE